jgi:accessory gene regulator B
MIARMSRNISSFFIIKGIILDEEREVYEYSFEILFSTIISFITVSIISIVSNTVVYTALYMFGFIPLRFIAGGYHAKSHLRCFFLLLSTYSAFLILISFLPPEYLTVSIFLSMFTSAVLIFFLAPSADTNKPISDDEFKNFKKKSRYAILGFILAIAIFMIIFTDKRFMLSIALGNISVAISLLANRVKTSILGKNNTVSGKEEIIYEED